MSLLGVELGTAPSFSWAKLKERRDFSIKRLNGIYVGNLESSGITHYDAMAKFIGKTDNGFQIQVSLV